MAAPIMYPGTPQANVEPLAYHQLAKLRPRSSAPWILATGTLFFALYLAVGWLMDSLPDSFLDFNVVSAPAAADRLFINLGTYTDPHSLFVTLMPVVIVLPLILLSSHLLQGRGIGYMSSVAGNLRWEWMAKCNSMAFVVMLLATTVELTVGAMTGAVIKDLDTSTGATLASILTILLLVPLQAAAEEYLFRGYLMQLVGRYLQHPIWAIVLPVPLLLFLNSYGPAAEIVGSIAVSLLVIAGGYLTWRTGGIEATVCMHVATNVMYYLMKCLGFVDAGARPEATVTGVGLIFNLIFVYLAIKWADDMGVSRTWPVPYRPRHWRPARRNVPRHP